MWVIFYTIDNNFQQYFGSFLTLHSTFFLKSAFIFYSKLVTQTCYAALSNIFKSDLILTTYWSQKLRHLFYRFIYSRFSFNIKLALYFCLFLSYPLCSLSIMPWYLFS